MSPTPVFQSPLADLGEAAPLFAAAYSAREQGFMDVWRHALDPGQTLPLWHCDTDDVLVGHEQSYQAACRTLPIHAV
jgi:hypothetical protein